MLRVFPILETEPKNAKFSNDWHQPRGNGRLHEGTDIIAKEGTPVIAVDDGNAAMGSNALGGNTVMLTNANGVRYYYAHLSAFEGEGRAVKTSEIIGYVGMTGNAKGTIPHLHFGIYVNGAAINPYPLLMDAPHLKPDEVYTPGPANQGTPATSKSKTLGFMLGGLGLGVIAMFAWKSNAHLKNPIQTGGWYVSKVRNKTKFLYGPYDNEYDAQRASYFHRSVADRDLSATRRIPVDLFTYTRLGVEMYDHDEIQSITATPNEYGYVHVIVRRRATMHNTWKASGATADEREHLWLRDFGMK